MRGLLLLVGGGGNHAGRNAAVPRARANDATAWLAVAYSRAYRNSIDSSTLTTLYK